jgi:hypothetical protein
MGRLGICGPRQLSLGRTGDGGRSVDRSSQYRANVGMGSAPGRAEEKMYDHGGRATFAPSLQLARHVAVRRASAKAARHVDAELAVRRGQFREECLEPAT